MAARKDKQARRMVSGHYVKDAYFFMQDLQEALMMNDVKNFTQTVARYAQRLVEVLDEMRPLIQSLANNLEANSPAEIITNWHDLK